MTAIIFQMATLFLIMASGYTANKFKIMTEESNRLVSKLVVNIAMPCTILGSVLGGQAAGGMEPVCFLILSFGAFLMAFIVCWPLPRLLRAREGDGGMYRFMTVFGNVGFMGFPVIQSVFGSGAVFYVTLYNIAFNVLCFSAGIIMVSGKSGKINPKLFINPTMVVSLLTVIVFYSKLQLPVI
jgi:predicted permease